MAEKNWVPVNTKGNSDTITREYLDSLVFEERLIGSVPASTDCCLFGVDLKTPVMTAAMSGYGRMREGVLTDMTEGIKAAGSLLWMGISEETEIETVGASGVPFVEIIKPYEDHAHIIQRIRHAKKCGCAAVGMDIDHIFGKNGGYDEDRDGRVLHTQSVPDLREYVDAADGTPFIVKGVLSVRDAEAAVKSGANAIVLSHHHNKFPFAVPPVMVLPEIRRAVGDSLRIIVDSQIKDGYDALKALALGADGVCVGRPLLAALTKDGAAGVTGYLSGMTAQLCEMMGRTGMCDLRHLDATAIRHIS